MPGCIIRSCPSRRSQQSEAVLHTFPRNAQRIRNWLQRTGHRFKDIDAFITRILEAKKSDGYGICSAHFTPDCYVTSGERRVLRAEAVPTIFPPGEKLISEVVQLRVSRKTRQARLQNAAKPADSASGLASVSSSPPALGAARMDAETQTEHGQSADPTEGQQWIKEEPGHRPPPGTRSVTVKCENFQEWDPPQNDPSDEQRSIKGHNSERILQLTLEIIYLLTGEDYGPIRKESGNRVTRSLIKALKKNNEQKILEVTNKIIELLTGEVPVRCQEVAMDEQEYEDHYKEVAMENEPAIKSQDVAENSTRSTKKSASDKKKGRYSRKSKDAYDPPLKRTRQTRGKRLAHFDIPTPALHKQFTSNKEHSSPSEEQPPLLNNARWTSHRKYPSSHVTEEQQPHENRLPKLNITTRTHRSEYPSPIQEQPSSSEEHLPCSDISTPHTGHPFDPSKEHSASGEEHLPSPVITTSTRRRRKRSSRIKKEPNFYKEAHSEDELDIRTIVEEEDSMPFEEHFPNSDICTSQGDPTSSPKIPFSNEQKRFRFSDCIPSGQLQADIPDMATHDGEQETLLSEDGLYTDTSAPPFPVDFSATGIYRTFLDHPEYFDHSLFCPECGKSFTDKARVEAHLLTHWGEKVYRCSMCPKKFRSQTRFFAHQMKHSGEKPYCCSECGKRFAQSTYLQRHMMGHTGEKPFPCSICGKGFTCKSDLVKHERTHTGARPHPCLVCNKRFTKKSHLNRHMRIHTGEKPFCCPDCGRNFGCNSDMVSHQRIHQGIKPFSCAECGKGFLRKQDAIRHQTTHRT